MENHSTALMIEPIPYQDTLAQIARESGIEAYYVGGLVRDRLLGRHSKDIDIVTVDRDPQILLDMLRVRLGSGKLSVVGRYGTCQLTTPDGIQIEGVRARSESYFFDSRKPTVKAGSLQDDIDRRDFTINCLIIPLDRPDVVLDPTGRGRGDLENKIIRTPMPPAQTFSDDPLRMLRAVRFASQLGFQIAPETEAGIKKSSTRLNIISRERIAGELNGILLSPNPAQGVNDLYALGLLREFAPDLVSIREHVPKRWNHALFTLGATPPDITLRWAALFHSLSALPAQSGVSGRDSLGAKSAHRNLISLRYPDDIARQVARLVELHPAISGYRSSAPDHEVRSLIWAVGTDMPMSLDLARSCLGQPHREPNCTIGDLENRIAALDPHGLLATHTLPLSGDQIMAELEIEQGPMVGVAKDELRRAVISGVLPIDDPAEAASWLMAQREVTSEPTSIGM